MLKRTVYGYLTLEEAAQFLAVSKSYLYKLTSKRKIPFYKPMGKRIYFRMADLESFIKSGRIASEEELQAEADKWAVD